MRQKASLKGNNTKEQNGSENTAYQSTWEVVKAVQRERRMALNAYVRNEESFQISNLSFYL